MGMLVLGGPAIAADMPFKAPALKAVYDRTGFYIESEVGYGSCASVPAPTHFPGRDRQGLRDHGGLSTPCGSCL
jgi:high affinity Mn2+ porin